MLHCCSQTRPRTKLPCRSAPYMPDSAHSHHQTHSPCYLLPGRRGGKGNSSRGRARGTDSPRSAADDRPGTDSPASATDVGLANVDLPSAEQGEHRWFENSRLNVASRYAVCTIYCLCVSCQFRQSFVCTGFLFVTNGFMCWYRRMAFPFGRARVVGVTVNRLEALVSISYALSKKISVPQPLPHACFVYRTHCRCPSPRAP